MPPTDLTLLLNQMQRGNRAAGEQSVELVYGELHRIASRELRGEWPGHLLPTVALIHEAYTGKQVAAALGVSLATLRRDRFARSWLFDRIQG